jgi:Mn2+/Fe2+ NRAMP family transporter
MNESAVAQVKKYPGSFKERIRWLGPGITWMAAGAGGAGELLFPPRVGSLYGYTFLWLMLIAIFLKWFINREIGRYAVCTGRPLLAGFSELPGFRNWAVWIILVPQIFVAIASLAGIAGAAATAFILLFPGSLKFWTAVTLITAALLLTTGGYKRVEKVAMIFAVALGLIGIITAISVFPEPSQILQGLQPSLPSNAKYVEIIPWLSFMLAGAAGMTWYSYWIPQKGYGAAGIENFKQLWKDEKNIKNLKGWIKEMTLDNSLGVIGGLMIVFSFLILGAELLGPKHLVPEQNKVAEVLGQLLQATWGKTGFWIMITGIMIGFWNTAMTNADGWARLFSNATAILLTRRKIPSKWKHAGYLRTRILWVILVLLPMGVYVIAGEPVGLLQMAGIIEVIHIPVIAGLTLWINIRQLHKHLRPSKLAIVLNVTACLFFVVFAGLFLWQMVSK